MAGLPHRLHAQECDGWVLQERYEQLQVLFPLFSPCTMWRLGSIKQQSSGFWLVQALRQKLLASGTQTPSTAPHSNESTNRIQAKLQPGTCARSPSLQPENLDVLNKGDAKFRQPHNTFLSRREACPAGGLNGNNMSVGHEYFKK